MIDDDEEEANERFWKGVSPHTPEERTAIAERTLKLQEKKKRSNKREDSAKYVPRLFSPEGRPYNVNQARMPFRLNDEQDRDHVILDVAAYKHLDTSFLDVDVQPQYVRVTIKGKVLQLTLSCEILTDKSTAQRNQTTGHLIITMPRLNPLGTIRRAEVSKKAVRTIRARAADSMREFLEIGPRRDDLDFSKIVGHERNFVGGQRFKENSIGIPKEKLPSGNFVDDPDVPPLE